MIGSLTGRLMEKSPAEILVETGGVGYRVGISLATYGRLPERGATVTLSIHTHVRQEALALYGFETRRERDLFETLIGVPGVGPRLGLALMSHLSPAEMAEAVRTRDTTLLTRVPGVGPRTAERLAVELAGAVRKMPVAAAGSPGEAAAPSLRTDLISALENLGYRTAQAMTVVEKLLARPGAGDQPVALLLKEALKGLAPAAGGGADRPPAPAPGSRPKRSRRRARGAP